MRPSSVSVIIPKSVKNFIKADALGMDCDNDHSENPADWNDILVLDNFLNKIQLANTTETVRNLKIPRDLNLGSLQNSYAEFSKQFNCTPRRLSCSWTIRRLRMSWGHFVSGG